MLPRLDTHTHTHIHTHTIYAVYKKRKMILKRPLLSFYRTEPRMGVQDELIQNCNAFSFSSDNISKFIFITGISERIKIPEIVQKAPQISGTYVDTSSESESETDEQEQDQDHDHDHRQFSQSQSQDVNNHITMTTTTTPSATTTTTIGKEYSSVVKPYIPSQTDTLFWSMYIAVNGMTSYETIDNHYCVANEFKYKSIEMMRKSKTILKSYKISLSDVEDELIHKQFISKTAFHALALLYKCNIVFVDGRKYYEMLYATKPTVPTYIVEINGKQTGIYYTEDAVSMLVNKYKSEYWQMDNLYSPIKAISSYNLADLIEISMKLGLQVVKIIPGEYGSIGTTKKKTKQELYDAIISSV